MYVYVLNNIDRVDFSSYIKVHCMITRLVMFRTKLYCKIGAGITTALNRTLKILLQALKICAKLFSTL